MLRASAIVVGLLVAPALVPVAALAVPAAIAQPHPGGFVPNPEPPPSEPRPAPEGRAYAPGDEPPAPGSHMRELEVRRGGPSGFWTSARPARGGSYRYRMLGIGLLVMGLTAFFVIRFLRRTSAARRLGPAVASRVRVGK